MNVKQFCFNLHHFARKLIDCFPVSAGSAP